MSTSQEQFTPSKRQITFAAIEEVVGGVGVLGFLYLPDKPGLVLGAVGLVGLCDGLGHLVAPAVQDIFNSRDSNPAV